jgi:hypothetical protein
VVAAGHELAQDLRLGHAVHEQVDLVERGEREDVGEAGVMGAAKASLNVQSENDANARRSVRCAGSREMLFSPARVRLPFAPG